MGTVTEQLDGLREALDLGFDGWIADYGEWLPADAVLDDGRTGKIRQFTVAAALCGGQR